MDGSVDEPVDNRALMGDKWRWAVECPVDRRTRRNTSAEPLAGHAASALDIRHVNDDGDRPGGDSGTQGAAGDRSSGGFPEVEDVVPRCGRPSDRPPTASGTCSGRPGEQSPGAGRGTRSRSAPAEQSDGNADEARAAKRTHRAIGGRADEAQQWEAHRQSDLTESECTAGASAAHRPSDRVAADADVVRSGGG